MSFSPETLWLHEYVKTQPTVEVARQLLGQQLRVLVDGEWHLLTIVETEAYTQDDPACHAYQRTTGRAANLYQRPGLAYVYLIYGMYYCLNITTEPEGTAGAVLFRGLVESSPTIGKNLKGANLIGPGRLCKALGITTATHNQLEMLSTESPLQLVAGVPVAKAYFLATPRIGISKATDRLWRFIDTRVVKK